MRWKPFDASFDASLRRLEEWGMDKIVKGRGKPKKTWIIVIENDMMFFGIGENMTMKRTMWKENIWIDDGVCFLIIFIIVYLILIYFTFGYFSDFSNFCRDDLIFLYISHFHISFVIYLYSWSLTFSKDNSC